MWRAFRARVEVGHGDVHAAILPFDPRDAWPDHAPVRRSKKDAPRGGESWPVRGTLGGQPFEGHVGRRYGRAYVFLGPELLARPDVKADEIEGVLGPLVPPKEK